MSNGQLPTANFQIAHTEVEGHLKIGSWKLAIGHSFFKWSEVGGKTGDGLRLSVDGRKITNFESIYLVFKFV
jgi:hypothetical protein